MKFILILLFSLINMPVFAAPYDEEINDIVLEMMCEINHVNSNYSLIISAKEDQIAKTASQLYTATTIDEKINLLLIKDRLRDELAILKKNNSIDITRLRYIKGLQIIRLLYDKVLSLDHHFSSVRTFSEINKITNPNQYPEFSKVKEIIAERKDKKTSVDLLGVLGSNPLMSVVQTFTNMMGSSLSKEEKDKELSNVDCIIDFTLRMHNDLNTIYYETSFLTASNDKIKLDLETLFKDYTKPIGYTDTLEKCRLNDDWESIVLKLNDYSVKVEAASGTSQDKLQINLAFTVDRLLQFITSYNNFIDQGGKFYEKFKIILNSYENEKQCSTKLPIEYKKLKEDIDIAINKFNVAYRPVEINGSKMKEILYGINELE